MSPRRKIAIIGAGTAGLASAIALAQRGHSIVVFEKQPTLAPVGAGILMQPQGMRALKALGCGLSFLEVSSPIRHLQLHNHRNQRLVHIPYDPPGLAYGVTRGNLTAVLQQRLQALGVYLEAGQRVYGLRELGGKVHFNSADITDEWEWSFDAAVLACGSNSALAAEAGFGRAPEPYAWGALNGVMQVGDWAHANELRQRVHGARRMLGLLPSGRNADGSLNLSFYWSLPAAAYPQWGHMAWPDFLAEVVALWPETEAILPALRKDDLAFARYRHATPETYANGRIALVGDAAHAMSPQLGLGSTLALEDALALAEAVTTEADTAVAFARYSKSRRPAARGKQRLSKALTPLFQSNLPAWARDPLFRLGQHVPGVSRLMAYSLGL